MVSVGKKIHLRGGNSSSNKCNILTILVSQLCNCIHYTITIVYYIIYIINLYIHVHTSYMYVLVLRVLCTRNNSDIKDKMECPAMFRTLHSSFFRVPHFAGVLKDESTECETGLHLNFHQARAFHHIVLFYWLYWI